MNQLTAPSIVRKFSQLLCTAASVVSMSLALFPSTAQAVGADGSFRVVSGKGSISFGGETQKIPKAVIDEIAGNQSAVIVVKDQKLKINRNFSAFLFQAITQESGITISNLKVTGPSSITLMPVGSNFAGKNTQPIITKFSVDDNGEKSSGIITTNANVTVKANSLTLTTRFVVTDGADKLSGVITLVGKR